MSSDEPTFPKESHMHDYVGWEVFSTTGTLGATDSAIVFIEDLK